jgi:peptide/nickel transport system substrate-binding protein
VWTGLPGDLDPQYAANFWPPLPRHQLGRLNAAQIAASDQAAKSPLGWGPFMFQSWQPGEAIVLQRNPNYWRAGEGLPHFDQVSYRFLAAPDDLVAGLRDGSCDVAPSGAAMNQVWGALQTDAKSGQVNLDNAASTVLEHLDFNLAPAVGYTGTAQSGIFQDLRVRQAFGFCLDPERLPGIPADPHLPLNHYDPNANVGLYDPAHGRDLLSQAGWTDSNGDGVIDKSGVPLTTSLAGDAAYLPLMQAIQSQLQANCGIALALHTLTVSELQGDWPEGVIFGRRFDLALFAWQAGALLPCALYTTAEMASAQNPGGANDTGYSNPDFDAACQKVVFPFDSNLASPDNLETQHLLARDLPMLPLGFELRHAAFRPGVLRYTLDPSSPSELWNIENISLAP